MNKAEELLNSSNENPDLETADQVDNQKDTKRFKKLTRQYSNVGLKLIIILISLIFMALMTTVPVSMIVIGSLYLDKCILDSNIPKWLIISGSIGLFSIILALLCLFCKELYSCCMTVLSAVFSFFVFIWLVCGNVLIYRVKDKLSVIPSSPNYCEPICYYFSIGIIAFGWSTLALFALLSICRLFLVKPKDLK